jgi:hypothetical protein
MARYAKEAKEKAKKAPKECAETDEDAEDAQQGETPAKEGQFYVKNKPSSPSEFAGQQLVANVSSLNEIQADADVDMVLFQYDEENPSWAVFASGKPVAEIQLLDQPNSADIRPLFLSKSYADTVKTACSKDGLQKTLEGIKARPYAVAIEKSAAMTQIRKELKAEQEDAVREARAEAAQDLMTSLGLVLTAMNKGFILENPLKNALYTSLSAMGVATPVQTVEAAFEKAGPEFFETAINQAREWAAYSPESYKQIEDSVHKAAKFVSNEITAAPVTPQVLKAQKAFPSLPVNVPLETKTANNGTVDRKEALRQRLSLK